MLIYYIRSRQYQYIRSGILTFTAVCLVIALPFLIIGPESILNLVSYHAQRGVQLESTYSTLLLAADKLGLISVEPGFSFGSWNVTGGLADILARLSTYLLVLFLFAAYWFIYGRTQPGKLTFTRLGTYALLVLTIVLVTSKVLSPQYLIWLLPFIPLIISPWRHAITAVFVVIGTLTYYIFPLRYLSLIEMDVVPVAVLISRNALLVLMAVFLGITPPRRKIPA